MDSCDSRDGQSEALNNWKYEDNVFPLLAHNRLLSIWTLIETWLRILQLLALLGVLTWSVLSLPELLRSVHTSNLHRHTSALTNLHMPAIETESDTSAEGTGASGALQTLEPEASPEEYCAAVSKYLSNSRTTSDWLFLVCLPSMAMGSAFGAVVSLICLPANRSRALGLGLLMGAGTTGWLLLTTTHQNRSWGSPRNIGAPGQQWMIAIDPSVYDKLMFAWTVNDLPAATLSMTLGVLLAIWFFRPLTRFAMRLVLPPASRWHIAWLWTADGLRVPGAQRNSS